MLRPDGAGEQSGCADPVLSGDDAGAGADQASERRGQPGQRIDLRGHEHQVRVPAQGVDEGTRIQAHQRLIDAGGHGTGLAAGAVEQRQSFRAQCLQGASVNKEPDLLAGRGQPGTEPAADASGADDDDPHACLLSVLLLSVRLPARAWRG